MCLRHSQSPGCLASRYSWEGLSSLLGKLQRFSDLSAGGPGASLACRIGADTTQTQAAACTASPPLPLAEVEAGERHPLEQGWHLGSSIPHPWAQLQRTFRVPPPFLPAPETLSAACLGAGDSAPRLHLQTTARGRRGGGGDRQPGQRRGESQRMTGRDEGTRREGRGNTAGLCWEKQTQCLPAGAEPWKGSGHHHGSNLFYAQPAAPACQAKLAGEASWPRAAGKSRVGRAGSTNRLSPTVISTSCSGPAQPAEAAFLPVPSIPACGPAFLPVPTSNPGFSWGYFWVA